VVCVWGGEVAMTIEVGLSKAAPECGNTRTGPTHATP
jgi:hypothetical protein